MKRAPKRGQRPHGLEAGRTRRPEAVAAAGSGLVGAAEAVVIGHQRRLPFFRGRGGMTRPDSWGASDGDDDDVVSMTLPPAWPAQYRHRRWPIGDPPGSRAGPAGCGSRAHAP